MRTKKVSRAMKLRAASLALSLIALASPQSFISSVGQRTFV
jgi:hypothetical protein